MRIHVIDPELTKVYFISHIHCFPVPVLVTNYLNMMSLNLKRGKTFA